MGKATIYSSLKSFLKIIFPPQCLHCNHPHDSIGTFLCKSCLAFLEIRPPTGHLLITFDKIGPAQSLMHHLKQKGSLNLAHLLAAFMAVQYSKSDHPLPDVITSVPTFWWRRWEMGYGVAEALAERLSKLLDRPYIPFLKRKRQLIRQELLPLEERNHLSSDDFTWRTQPSLQARIVLLVDDTITTGATLASCAHKLWDASPAKIVKMACVDRGYLRE